MPRGSPFGPVCASTLLPKLIAARNRPAGANSFSTGSGAAAGCAAAGAIAAIQTTIVASSFPIALMPHTPPHAIVRSLEQITTECGQIPAPLRCNWNPAHEPLMCSADPVDASEIDAL